MNNVTRIKDLPKTATTDDLKVGNYVAIDGNDGTMKFPAENLKKENAVFYATPDVTTYSEISSALDKGQDVFVVSRGFVYRLNATISPNFVFERNEVWENGDVYLNTISVNSSDVWTSGNTQIAKFSDVPTNVVSSTDVTAIVKVSAMPENPDPNTLYLVVEEEPTTASEVE